MSPAILLGTPGDAGKLMGGLLGFLGRCSGKEEVLVKPSVLLDTPSDIRCECHEGLRLCVDGSERLGVLGCDAVTCIPLVLMSTGLRDFRRTGSLGSPDSVRAFLDAVVVPVTVALLPSFCAAGKVSEITSSTGRGLRA